MFLIALSLNYEHIFKNKIEVQEYNNRKSAERYIKWIKKREE